MIDEGESEPDRQARWIIWENGDGTWTATRNQPEPTDRLTRSSEEALFRVLLGLTYN